MIFQRRLEDELLTSDSRAGRIGTLLRDLLEYLMHHVDLPTIVNRIVIPKLEDCMLITRLLFSRLSCTLLNYRLFVSIKFIIHGIVLGHCQRHSVDRSRFNHLSLLDIPRCF